MATEFKLSYTGSEINEKLGKIDDFVEISEFVGTKERLSSEIVDVNMQLTQKINIERARIDNIVALPDGSTTGDAELQDIRVGHDGVVYDSAGTAVRKQFLEVINMTGAKTEKITERLGATYISSLPDNTTFTAPEASNVSTLLLFRTNNTTARKAKIAWDSSQMSSFEFVPYLLKDGVPYKYSQKGYNSENGESYQFSGEVDFSNLWINPGQSWGMLVADSTVAPYVSFEIPDGCSLMVSVRVGQAATTLPDGSILSFSDSVGMGQWVKNGGITVDVEDTTYAFPAIENLGREVQTLEQKVNDAWDYINPVQQEVTEPLAVVPVASYPNNSTFEYAEVENNSTVLVFKVAETSGGRAKIAWDSSQMSSFEFVPYLLKDGVPYKYSQKGYNSENYGIETMSGDMDFSKLWINPGQSWGFVVADASVAPYIAFDVPSGCNLMVCVRLLAGSGQIPSGSSLSYDNLADASKWAQNGGITVSVSHTVADSSVNLEVKDIRKAFDGKVYPTAGDAVRAQIGLALNSKTARKCFIKSIAHRGFSSEAPENTLSAFRLAKKKGYEYGECDVAFTSDGVAVLLHDSTIDRTSNGTGAIHEMTYETVLQYDFGAWMNPKYAGEKIPTFEEFIILCKRIGLKPYIEIKTDVMPTNDQIVGLINTVKRYGMLSDATWICCYASCIDVVRANLPKARVGLVVGSILDSNIVWATNLMNGTDDVFIDARIYDLTESAIESCAAASIPIEVWTVNDSGAVLTIDPYISGITSDSLIADDVLQGAYTEATD